MRANNVNQTRRRVGILKRVNGGVLVARRSTEYLAVRPRRYRQTFPINGPASLIYHGTQEELALFVNDRFALGRTPTLTAGLRWEGQWNPDAAQSKSGYSRNSANP